MASFDSTGMLYFTSSRRIEDAILVQIIEGNVKEGYLSSLIEYESSSRKLEYRREEKKIIETSLSISRSMIEEIFRYDCMYSCCVDKSSVIMV